MHDLNVSRETLERLQAFEALFRRWNARINLASKASLNEFWSRHVADSLQLAQLHSACACWVDLGSGGGFPGIVVAIALSDETTEITLVESDMRKSAFLRTAIRELNLRAEVIADRIETVAPLNADVLSARALADLDQLLAYAHHHLGEHGRCLFPKGALWRDEVKKARDKWNFDLEVYPSKTDKQAAILDIRNLKKA